MGRKFEIYNTNAEYDFEEARKEFAEVHDVPVEDVTDEEVSFFVEDDAQFSYECETENLDVATEGKILAIADLGLWNGRVSGFAMLGNNLKYIMTNGNEDYFRVFSDGRDICKTADHHDGTNHIIYREVRKGVNIDKLTTRIYNNETIDRKTLNYYTKSLLPAVTKIYG